MTLVRHSRNLLLALALLALVPFGLARPLAAQGGFGGGRGNDNVSGVLWGIPDVPSGFYICRLAYTTVAQDPSGSGWRIEYPRADINLMVRLSQLTTTGIAYWSDGRSGGIGHTVVRADDPELMRCPYLNMASPGTAGFNEREREGLRNYLLKGGFLWADDFWGNGPWNQWMSQISQILPEYPVVELTPDHPLFSILYKVPEVPQIPSLNRWSPGMPTQELPGAEYANPTAHGIFDETGRLMVLMTHNTDIHDGFEREADLDQFFVQFSWKAYALGVNVALWVLSH